MAKHVRLRDDLELVATPHDWLATVVLDGPATASSAPHACHPVSAVVKAPASQYRADPVSAAVKAPASQYRADVDGLRAIAVLAVIAFHMDPSWLPGGFVGVDVFFVISGYIVTSTLVRDLDGDQSRSFLQQLLAFYCRRAKRLAPALVLVVLATSIAIALFVPPGLRTVNVDEFYLTGQLSLLGVANQYLATRSRSYWEEQGAHASRNPFTHLWSLGVEEQVISHHLPPSPTISHHRPPSPTIAHNLPSSPTISHHLP